MTSSTYIFRLQGQNLYEINIYTDIILTMPFLLLYNSFSGQETWELLLQRRKRPHVPRMEQLRDRRFKSSKSQIPVRHNIISNFFKPLYH